MSRLLDESCLHLFQEVVHLVKTFLKFGQIIGGGVYFFSFGLYFEYNMSFRCAWSNWLCSKLQSVYCTCVWYVSCVISCDDYVYYVLSGLERVLNRLVIVYKCKIPLFPDNP